MGNNIFVKKRSDERELLNFEKINKVLLWATENIAGVSASDVAMNAHLQIFDGITTKQIHEILVRSASDLISEKTPNYQYVAGNLLNYLIRKDIFDASNNLPSLYDVIVNNVDLGVYDKLVLEKYSKNDIDDLDKLIKHDRDYNFTYAGIQQLVDKYLLKDRKTNRLYETPQYAYMLIAMTVFADSTDRFRLVKEAYNQFSTHKISLPTPIMSGVRTPNRQWSSCTLIDVGDSLDSIFHSNSAVGYYTSKRAGIGLNMGRVRAMGDTIRGGEVVHTGVIPFLRMFQSTTKSCTQNGIRGGHSTTHFPFWHREIEDILVLKNNKGTDDNRVRHMDYSIQMNRLFYRRFMQGGDISLFSPNDVPDMYEAFFQSNNKFEELYEKYEKNKKIKKQVVKASDLFNQLVQERIGTGRIYIMNVDHANEHSAFNDSVYMSNLCQEVCLPTSPINNVNEGIDGNGEIALCVLGAVNLGVLKDIKDLELTMNILVRCLDFIIENQDYPVETAKKMLYRRSLGIGITNFAYWLAKNNVNYDTPETLPLVDELMEHIQYYGLKASVELAKEFGKCEYFNKTKYSLGVLPIDTYNKNVDSIVNREHSLDWEELRDEIKIFGLRNSCISAVMPCESSSLITNSTNGIEPIRDFVTTKKSKQGLIRMVVPEIGKLKNKYQLAFDLNDNRGITNIQAVITKWIDQAISGNHYYDITKFENNEIPMSTVVKDIMYAYKMGVKTLYYANTNDDKNDEFTQKNNEKNKQSELIEETIDGCIDGACTI
jgi:ribonucleoside-diphosphate reductase alpha chain